MLTQLVLSCALVAVLASRPQSSIEVSVVGGAGEVGTYVGSVETSTSPHGAKDEVSGPAVSPTIEKGTNVLTVSVVGAISNGQTADRNINVVVKLSVADPDATKAVSSTNDASKVESIMPSSPSPFSTDDQDGTSTLGLVTAATAAVDTIVLAGGVSSSGHAPIPDANIISSAGLGDLSSLSSGLPLAVADPFPRSTTIPPSLHAAARLPLHTSLRAAHRRSLSTTPLARLSTTPEAARSTASGDVTRSPVVHPAHAAGSPTAPPGPKPTWVAGSLLPQATFDAPQYEVVAAHGLRDDVAAAVPTGGEVSTSAVAADRAAEAAEAVGDAADAAGDVDAANTADSAPATLRSLGAYGTLTILPTGEWIYVADTRVPMVRSFGHRVGVLRDVFQLEVADADAVHAAHTAHADATAQSDGEIGSLTSATRAPQAAADARAARTVTRTIQLAVNVWEALGAVAVGPAVPTQTAALLQAE